MTAPRDRYHKMLNTTRWRKLRALHLARHPFCADCAAEGVVTPATEVHHIRPVSMERDPARMERLAFDAGNLAGLCHACHVKRHERMGKGTAEENARRQRAEADLFARRFYGTQTPGGCFSATGAPS